MDGKTLPHSRKTVLKLGTRRSLLAMAQSRWVALQIEKNNPGISVELVGIDTRGDQIQDVPLQSVEGKDFFVAEIDAALKSKEVDLTVHSFKDLSLDRPKELVCAAIPKRENPRDVLLFHSHSLRKLETGEPVRIGTSSPRRLENIPAFLEQALPRSMSAPDRLPALKFLEIRGNVNTRISRLHEPASSERHLDGVILAFAGLIRLWADEEARAELSKLLRNLRWMVLPLKECPAAPAQGALAIECRKEDKAALTAIQKLHDKETEAQVYAERKILAASGGGCHQRFGATAISFSNLKQMLFIRGTSHQGDEMNSLEWSAPEISESLSGEIWDGTRFPGRFHSLEQKIEINTEQPVFVAHSRAVPDLWTVPLRHMRVWTSGSASWFKLAHKGIWVEGCAEALGFEFILPTLQEKVLALPKLYQWQVLTHDGAQDGWSEEKVIPTYQIFYDELGEKVLNELQQASFIYWSSGSQFEALKKKAPKKAIHACGPGKTAKQLSEGGLKPVIFPNSEEWKKWVSKHEK